MSEKNNRITPDEAREALELIQKTTRQMRRTIAQGGAPYYLILWGAIWILGFGISYLLGPDSRMAGTVWMALSTLGILTSFGIGWKLSQRVRSPQARRIGMLWIFWIVYGILIVTFAKPQSADQMSLLICLLVMMAYVTSGVFYRSRFLIGLGLAITALVVVGYLVVPKLFDLWMAILGGGSLMAAGVYILRFWR